MRITSAGNVGIGTSTPAYKLHVITNDSSYGMVHESTSIRLGSYISSTSNVAQAQIGTMTNHKLGFFTNNGGPSMIIDTNGRIGIGRTVPDYPLDINGYASYGGSGGAYWWGWSSAGNTLNYSANANGANFSIQTTHGIVINNTSSFTGYFTISDCRIKENIRYDTASRECVDIIRTLKPCSYNYINGQENRHQNVYGFIAQDVKPVVPYSVTIKKSDFVPNIYSIADVTTYANGGGGMLVTCRTRSSDTYHVYELHDASGNALPIVDATGNTHIRIKLYDKLNKEYVAVITKIIENGVFVVNNETTDNDTPVLKAGEEYFLYGQEVDDYHVLNHEALSTIGVCALQEVDRQQQADKARIAELETEIVSLKQELDKQQTLIKSILEKLSM
jgi:Chaperone of endosialidase